MENEKESFVVDTHALVWFISKDFKLTDTARNVLQKAERSEVEVFIPTIVLAELLYISEKKRILLSIEEVLERISKGGKFVIVPFDMPILLETMKLSYDFELHDRIIIATAILYKAKVITIDEEIKKSGIVDVLW